MIAAFETHLRLILKQIKAIGLVRGALPTLGGFYYRKEMRKSPNVLNVDIKTKMGLGAIIAYALKIYAFSERHGLKANEISSSPLYSDAEGADFFGNFFEPRITDGTPIISDLATRWIMHFGISDDLCLLDASKVFNREFVPNKFFLDQLQIHIGQCNWYDLSIHYRGTDKIIESGVVDYSKIIFELDDFLPVDGNIRNVFLATDDGEFSDVVRKKFAHVNFHSFDIGFVPKGVPRHFSNLSGNDKALEALMNSYLLSRSDMCVRTSSFLSGLSKIINPSLRTRTVNWTKTRDLPFPEQQIYDSECGV